MLSRAIDGALLAAELAWQDINFFPPRYGYNAFFKNTAYPVKLTFRELANYEPYAPRGRHIVWVCVTERATQEIRTTCAQIPSLTYFIHRGIIFICPLIFEWPPEPPVPNPRQCPGVRDNIFVSSMSPHIRSNNVLSALARYRLPIGDRQRGPFQLNQLVAMTAHQAYLNPLSYSCYAAMAKNRCRAFPDIRLPPWGPYPSEPTTPTNRTTMPFPTQEQDTGIEMGEVLAEGAGADEQLGARAMSLDDVGFVSR
ncbi:MAG: hypothetical protein LQ342_005631 [Letrouitia transgressa]|nr:MAG: hypothetical protein LQ342_005631 [Letrouitia transgressa]